MIKGKVKSAPSEHVWKGMMHIKEARDNIRLSLPIASPLVVKDLMISKL